MRKDILESKSKIEVWVKENRPKAWMAEQLDCKIDTLNSYLNKWNIQYKGNMGARGYKPSPYKKNATQYLKSGSFIVTSKLRTKLIEEGLKQNKCEICGISEWNGNPISLELHHKDCNRYNNQLSNLQILCPNCHSQTPNHSRKKPR